LPGLNVGSIQRFEQHEHNLVISNVFSTLKRLNEYDNYRNNMTNSTPNIKPH